MILRENQKVNDMENKCKNCGKGYTTVSPFKEICCLDCFEIALKDNPNIRDFYLYGFEADYLKQAKSDSIRNKKKYITKHFADCTDNCGKEMEMKIHTDTDGTYLECTKCKQLYPIGGN